MIYTASLYIGIQFENTMFKINNVKRTLKLLNLRNRDFMCNPLACVQFFHFTNMYHIAGYFPRCKFSQISLWAHTSGKLILDCRIKFECGVAIMTLAEFGESVYYV